MHQGDLFIIAAPSGGGKTTLIRRLMDADDELRLSVSWTTRAPRPGEVVGLDYHFVNENDFETRVAEGGFLEWARVHGNLYGTSRAVVEETIATGCDLLLEIDWQGAERVRRHFPEAVSLFLMPPSLETLERRLTARATDTAETVARRMSNAVTEMGHAGGFDYVIVNDQFEAALADVQAVIRSARLRAARQLQRLR